MAANYLTARTLATTVIGLIALGTLLFVLIIATNGYQSLVSEAEIDPAYANCRTARWTKSVLGHGIYIAAMGLTDA